MRKVGFVRRKASGCISALRKLRENVPVQTNSDVQWATTTKTQARHYTRRKKIMKRNEMKETWK